MQINVSMKEGDKGFLNFVVVYLVLVTQWVLGVWDYASHI